MEQGPQFRIISAYKGMADYIKAAKADPQADLTSLWSQYVVEPFWADWAQGQPNEQRLKEQFSKPILELDELEVQVELLEQSGVEQIVERAMRDVTAALPKVEETVICLYALHPRRTIIRDKQHGVLGSCMGDNILIEINPLAVGWQSYIRWVVAHEYHHSVWGYYWYYLRGYRNGSLLVGLVNDGEADSFAKLLCPELSPRWINALTGDQERQQWRIIQDFLDDDSFPIYRRFMFGDEAAGTPWCTGYTLGYQIVQSYLRSHPDITINQLLQTDPVELLSNSGYGTIK